VSEPGLRDEEETGPMEAEEQRFLAV